MSAVATKPRATGRRAQKETSSNAAARITASVLDKLAKLDGLTEAGIAAGGESGDLGGRLFWQATEVVMPKVRAALGEGAFNDESVGLAAHQLYDLQALVAGAAAMHGKDSRGAIASSAVELIDSITSELDQPGIWPDAVKEAEPATTAEPDPRRIGDAMAEAHNAVAVFRAAAPASDGHWAILALAERARDATQAAEDAGDDREKIEDASCCYAQAIAICSAFNTPEVDDELLRAGESLLVAAKAILDDLPVRTEELLP